MTTERKVNTELNKHGVLPWGVGRADIWLYKGRVSDVFRVEGGPCRIFCMFMEITEAVAAGTLNMTWQFDSDAGGYRTLGDAVDIAASAVGDFYVAELDSTTIVQVTTGTGVINGYWYEQSTTNGTIVTEGGIDIKLSDATSFRAGKGSLYVFYQPLVENARLVAAEVHTSTTTTSTTTSSTSSTSSSSSSTSTTSSTSSTTSSTSSSASTSSSTSSTSSSASTSSSTSSTTSTTTTAA